MSSENLCSDAITSILCPLNLCSVALYITDINVSVIASAVATGLDLAFEDGGGVRSASVDRRQTRNTMTITTNIVTDIRIGQVPQL